MRPPWIKFVPLLLCCLIQRVALSQSDIRSGSSKKELTLGEPVDIYLVYEHAPELSVLFPDTSFNFEPFELIGRKYFPTITENGISKDCTIYQARLFDIVGNPTLTIPVYILSNGDSISIYPPPVSFKLHELLPELPEHPVLKESDHWENIEHKTNFPLIIVSFLAIISLLILAFHFLGQPILRRIRIYNIIQNHRSFVARFEKFERVYATKRNTEALKNLLSLWKDYLGAIENKPIATYTSTEITELFRKEDLKDALIVIDRAIFGGITSGAVMTAIGSLKKFANARYINRKHELREG